MPEEDTKPRLNFIQEIVEADLRTGKWGTPGDASVVCTRFPPEPNGYLHIGHAKSILLNYGLAAQYGGTFNLRFDDTNPVKEEQEYVDAIVRDARWLGAKWPGMRPREGAGRCVGAEHDPAGVLFSSDYFQQMYDWAVELVRKGKAYVDDLTPEQIRAYRGTLTAPGRNSPHRDRGVDENLDLFERMRTGEFLDGSKVLRAKIDMASPNINLRDPIMYRVLHAAHHRSGDAWCVYPMYDWAHGIEDSIEGITHSICTLEFENHRPLYDWFLDAINEGRTEDGSGAWGRRIHHPQQIEFARLNLSHTVMSKRKLLELVKGGHVEGWDDPRMPTLGGMRRRGFTAQAIQDFCTRIGVAKFDGVSAAALLEHCVRQDLNKRCPRVMGVLRPLRVVITNWQERHEATEPRSHEDEGAGRGAQGARDTAGSVDWLEAVNNPEDPNAGTRTVPFGKVIYIERDDFMEDAPRKFFRLSLGREVRLRYAYFITCNEVVKDDAGELIELRCTYDPLTRGGDAPDGRKVKGTLHWVSAAHAVDAGVRMYEHLMEEVTKVRSDEVTKGEDAGARVLSRPPDWLSSLNPDSLQVLTGCKLEPNWRDAAEKGDFDDGVLRVQFERQGYFCLDKSAAEVGRREGGKAGALVFNRTLSLRDSWAKSAKTE